MFIVASGCISSKINLSYACIFASGALLTASFLHIIPEALEGLEAEFDNLHDMGIYGGVATLGGISLGVLLHIVFETGQHPHADINQDGTASSAVATSSIAKQDINPVNKENGVSSQPNAEGTSGSLATPQSSEDRSNENVPNLQSLMEARKGKALTDVKNLHPGCWNIIIGDFVHNFADGVTIGAAFLGCNSTVGWTVAASTVIHEVPQELADFMALVNGGMSKTQVRAKYTIMDIISLFQANKPALAWKPSTTSLNKRDCMV